MKKLLIAITLLLFSTVAFAQAVGQGHVEYKWRGLYSEVNLAMGKVVSKDYNDVSFKEYSASFGFYTRKECGFGIGASYLHDANGGYTQLPFYVELRSHFLMYRLTPFTALQVGYTFPLGESSGGPNAITIDKGGAYFAVNLGLMVALSHQTAVDVYAGYQMLNLAKVTFKEHGKDIRYDPVLMHVVRVGVGLNF